MLNEYARTPNTVVDADLLRAVGQEMYYGVLRNGDSRTKDSEALEELNLRLPSKMVAAQRQIRTELARHPVSHALLVTDGVPTLGCTSLTAEREEARSMGLCVHTVFIGDSPEYPGALGDLAKATGGVRFQAVIDQATGHVKLLDRERSSAP